MLLEPSPYRRGADDGFRFLVIAHTILGHLSALGAHRHHLQQHPADHPDDPAMACAYDTLIDQLDRIARALSERTAIELHEPGPEVIAASLEPQPEENDEGDRLVPTQLALICRQITPLAEAAGRLIDSARTGARTAEAIGQTSRSG